MSDLGFMFIIGLAAGMLLDEFLRRLETKKTRAKVRRAADEANQVIDEMERG